MAGKKEKSCHHIELSAYVDADKLPKLGAALRATLKQHGVEFRTDHKRVDARPFMGYDLGDCLRITLDVKRPQ